MKKILPRALAVLFWLGAWQALSMAVNQAILLVSPMTALATLFRLMGTSAFYRAILTSFGRILLGFLMAVGLGVALAALAARFRFVRTLLDPLMSTIKATPVASFVILALVWISARNLSVFTAFLMVLPLIYTNV
ncbi:MAG: nitrate ABC transporter permease, partial [Clostridia bacterium]